MPRTKSTLAPRRRYGAKSSAMGRRIARGPGNRIGRRLRTVGRMISNFHASPNTASVKEAYQVTVPDGNITFFRTTALSDLLFDRAQTVAQAYQQYRIKYIKLTFKPSADTFPAVAGNTISQLYFMYDKANAIPTNANAGTFFSMGARPRRMDDKNLIYAWKPTALAATYTAAGVTTASLLRTSPWLATNQNSGNPQPGWAPSDVDHLGAVFYVTKINPADTLNYTVDVEVLFEFRKPLWKVEQSSEPPAAVQQIDGGVLKPMAI